MIKFMIRKNGKIILLAGIFLFAIIFSSFQIPPESPSFTSDEHVDIYTSTGLEGAENIIMTDVLRNVNVSGSGVINIGDRLTLLNRNSNPITSILVGIPLNLVDNLIFFRARGESKNMLFAERSNLIMNDNEMITIYFDNPLLPNQEITVTFLHTYINIPNYYLISLDEQNIDFSMNPFPILPYKTEKHVETLFNMPATSVVSDFERVEDIGIKILDNIYSYDLKLSIVLDNFDPFLGNIKEDEKEITITFQDNEVTQMQIESVNREILISAWGIIRIREEIIIQNIGVLSIPIFALNVPKSSKNVYVYDDIGDLERSDLTDNEDNPEVKTFSINLASNRALLIPGSKYRFTVEYKLPFEEYTSLNWLEESVKINLLTTTHEFYAIEENTNIIIEGANGIEYISITPDAVKHSRGSTILTFISKNVSPIERYLIQFNFTVDLFNLLLRPIIIMLLIALIMSIYVVIIKTRKTKEEKDEFKREFIPINEIREFCSLYEEKNALTLEIRRAEEEAKRKKMAKKTYSNILTKNGTKIDQIKQELLPFKKILMETNETFENIIKKLDVLDAERVSVDDSLNLLETRYKRGRLPSKAAYEKLSDDFVRRRNRIDRTIDKHIQQLRSYLL